jgi:hypothetical protein
MRTVSEWFKEGRARTPGGGDMDLQEFHVVSGCLIAQWNMSAVSLGVFTRDKLGLYLKNVIELEGIHFR